MAVLSVITQDMTLYAVKRAYMKKFYKEFREANKQRFESTSPYSVTDILPKLRIVDNAIQTGKGNPIHISSSSTVHRGFFGGVKGVENHVKGGGGDWKLDTKVQFDKVYMCPVTDREFTDKDMEEYKKNLYSEGEVYAEGKIGPSVEITRDPATLNIMISGDAWSQTFNQEDFDKFINRRD